mmetsp:Transcript_39845/g.95877  ORF Transcript_39845/g.95877 Transcript_39845/m.95877 type:complete len:310 (-) Transcript_39845:18-947(-)
MSLICWSTKTNEMLLCKKRKGVIKPGQMNVINEVIENEDLAFHISSYLLHLCNNLCFVSKQWNEAFSLVRAQKRWDYLTHHIGQDEDKEWLYHKLSYFPGATLSSSLPRTVPREGCLNLFRSRCSDACDEATKQYKSNIQNDQGSGINRSDSRPDYYYRAHRESPECIEFVLPRPLLWNNPIHYINEIKFDDRPRLVNKFIGCIGDINGATSPLAEEKSKEGLWNLGYHEIKSVRDMTTSNLSSRPPFNCHGEDTTNFLRACRAKPSDDPRWLKFCHLVGEDRCRLFLKKHLLPMIGPRPTGNVWKSSD